MIKLKIFVLAAAIFLTSGFIGGASAQDITLNDLNGAPVKLSSYKGKPTMLFFWTTWCPYCRKELKKLNEIYPEIAKDGISVAGVNVNEPSYKVQKFFKDYALNIRILLDENGLLAEEYNLFGVPTYVFLDEAGKVISKANKLPDNYKAIFSQ